jgi:CheY-like chemotaxis protein
MSAPSSDFAALRIVVVENHGDTLKYLTLYLEQLGHTVASATSMEAALTALPGADCDVLISDIGLSDGDGWELLQRAHSQLPRPLYAIAMSGFGMNADHARSKAAGFRHHILKPFDPDDLDAMLEEARREAVAAHAR